MIDPVLLDAAGRRRSSATMPGSTAADRHEQALRYPADPPTVGEIVSVMRVAGDKPMV